MIVIYPYICRNEKNFEFFFFSPLNRWWNNIRVCWTFFSFRSSDLRTTTIFCWWWWWWRWPMKQDDEIWYDIKHELNLKKNNRLTMIIIIIINWKIWMYLFLASVAWSPKILTLWIFNYRIIQCSKIIWIKQTWLTRGIKIKKSQSIWFIDHSWFFFRSSVQKNENKFGCDLIRASKTVMVWFGVVFFFPFLFVSMWIFHTWNLDMKWNEIDH